MTTFRYTRLFHRALPAGLLLLTLARGPGLRPAAELVWRGAAPAGWVLVQAVGWIGLLGAPVDALAGATQLVAKPANPAEAKVGVPIEIKFSIIDTPTVVKSYRISGKLPPGLTIVDLDHGVVTESEVIIKGTPGRAGTYTLNVQGCEQYFGFGHRTRQELVINVAEK